MSVGDDPTAWQRWVDKYHYYHYVTLRDAIGQVVAIERRNARKLVEQGDVTIKRELDLLRDEFVALQRAQLDQLRDLREKLAEARAQQEEKDAVARYEVGLVRRELVTLREELGLERKFKILHEEIAEARADIPKLPAIEARLDAEQKHLEAEQARLERELAKTKERVSKMRVDQSIANYNLAELQKQAEASRGASIEMEFESRSSRFQMKAAHPEAAKALQEFAAQIIDGQRDGTLWLPDPAGNA
jgi:chromosome segregation ATPase